VPVERLDAGLAVLSSWGLHPVEGAHARAAHGHLAGSDEQRIADLNRAFRDPAVRAVWAARGGYGLTRIVDRLDWPALAADPKLLIGFSDVSALLLAAWQRIGLVSLHGQVVARLHLLAEQARERLRRGVLGQPAALREPVAGTVAHTTGRVSGRLVGGNLAVLAALAGTPDRLRASGCIVMLEEVDEPPYRVDRLLTQLRASGALDGVVGIVVGAPVRCEPAAGARSATFDEVVAERLGDLGVPVLTNLPVGHVDDQLALVYGTQAALDMTSGTLELCEAFER
jgi:muramoyltetrapeptide carboxypeptidase